MHRRMISVIALVLCMIMLVGCSSAPKDGSFGVQLEDLVEELRVKAEAGGIVPLEEKTLEKAKAEEDLYEGFYTYLFYLDGCFLPVFFETNDAGNVCHVKLYTTILDSQRFVDNFARHAGLITGHLVGNEQKAREVFSDLGMETLQIEEKFERSTVVGDITYVFGFSETQWYFEIQSPAFVEAMAARED